MTSRIKPQGSRQDQMKKQHRHDIDLENCDPLTRLYLLNDRYEAQLRTMKGDKAQEHEIKAVELKRQEAKKEMNHLFDSWNIRLQFPKPDKD